MSAETFMDIYHRVGKSMSYQEGERAGMTTEERATDAVKTIADYGLPPAMVTAAASHAGDEILQGLCVAAGVALADLDSVSRTLVKLAAGTGFLAGAPVGVEWERARRSAREGAGS